MMDKKEAIELLEEALTKVSQLRELRHGDQKFTLWYDRVRNIIKAALDSEDLQRFSSRRAVHVAGMFPDEVYQQDYLGGLEDYETALQSIIEKYKLLGFESEPQEVSVKESPKAFIAHGGDSPALGKLKNFLVALGVQPLVVEEQASEGRSVGEKVDWYSQQADCAIILAAKGDIDGKTGDFIPRGNVLMEIGKLQHLYKDKTIYLLQANTRFPSNISEKVWVRFSPQSMDNSFTTIARELKAFGILKAVKP